MLDTPRPARSLVPLLALLLGATAAGDEARLVPVLTKGIGARCVYIDATGKIVLKGPYSEARPFSDGLALVVPEDGAWQIIDGAGKTVATLKEEVACEAEFHEGFAAAQEKGDPKRCPRGYIDRTGKMAIRCATSHAGYGCFLRDFSGGRAIQIVAEKHGIVDTAGKVILAPSHDVIQDFTEGLAGFRRETREPYGYLKPDGTVAIEPKFQKINLFSEGLAWVCKEDLWGAINPKGDFVIPAKFLNAMPFAGGVAPVLVGGDGPNSKIRIWGLVDKKGKLVHQGTYDYIAGFSEGLAPFSKDGETWGWLDAKGKVAIPPQWKNLPPAFRFGLALNDTGVKKTYLNKSGKVVWTEEPR
jgi:hypothetical protein